MRTQKRKLLASSGTEEGIKQLINEFFYSASYTVMDGKPHNTETGRTLPGYVVLKRGRRWRFEAEV